MSDSVWVVGSSTMGPMGSIMRSGSGGVPPGAEPSVAKAPSDRSWVPWLRRSLHHLLRGPASQLEGSFIFIYSPFTITHHHHDHLLHAICNLRSVHEDICWLCVCVCARVLMRVSRVLLAPRLCFVWAKARRFRSA